MNTERTTLVKGFNAISGLTISLSSPLELNSLHLSDPSLLLMLCKGARLHNEAPSCQSFSQLNAARLRTLEWKP